MNATNLWHEVASLWQGSPFKHVPKHHTLDQLQLLSRVESGPKMVIRLRAIRYNNPMPHTQRKDAVPAAQEAFKKNARN